MIKERIVWIDALNIFACAGVVLLHSTNKAVHHFQGIINIEWIIGLLSHSLFLWPVNIFFMLSGFTLVKYSVTKLVGVKTFYSRRLVRLAIPLLTWSFIYWFVYILEYHRIESPLIIVKRLLLFNYNSYMWFFVPLLIIYISMPFISLFLINAERGMIRLFLILGLLLAIFPCFEKDYTVREGLPDFYLMGTRFIYFIVAGFYFGKYQISLHTRKTFYILALVSIVIMFIGTAILSIHVPAYYDFFIKYTNLPCTITSIAIFLLFRYTDWNKWLYNLHISKGTIAKWSSLSLGIYLIQSIFLKILDNSNLYDISPIYRFVLIYIVSLFSVLVMHKIPLIKKIV